MVCRTLGGIEALSLDSIASPMPAIGQARVNVQVAALNFPDLLIIEGKYQAKPPLPFVPGMELSGVVDMVGEGVASDWLGRRVSAVVTWGAFAEHTCVDEDRLVALPDDVDLRVGAALGLAYQTVWHALKTRAGLRAGERLLVLGASGGIGLAAIQLGRQMGATVIAAASTQAKLDACLAQGADHVINYGADDLRTALAAIVGRDGVDVVVDPVGGVHAEAAMRSLGWRGRYLVVGFANGAIPKIALNLALLSERDIRGVYVGEYFRREPAARAAVARELLSLVTAGRFTPLVSREFPLADYAQALTALREREVIGKVLLSL